MLQLLGWSAVPLLGKDKRIYKIFTSVLWNWWHSLSVQPSSYAWDPEENLHFNDPCNFWTLDKSRHSWQVLAVNLWNTLSADILVGGDNYGWCIYHTQASTVLCTVWIWLITHVVHVIKVYYSKKEGGGEEFDYFRNILLATMDIFTEESTSIKQITIKVGLYSAVILKSYFWNLVFCKCSIRVSHYILNHCCKYCMKIQESTLRTFYKHY